MVITIGYREHELHQQHIQLSIYLAEGSIGIVEHLVSHHIAITHPHSDLVVVVEVVMVVIVMIEVMIEEECITVLTKFSG